MLRQSGTEEWCGLTLMQIARREKARRRAIFRAKQEAMRGAVTPFLPKIPASDAPRPFSTPSGLMAYRTKDADGYDITLPWVSMLGGGR